MRRFLIFLMAVLVVGSAGWRLSHRSSAPGVPPSVLAAAQARYRAGQFAQAEALASAQLASNTAARQPGDPDLLVLRGLARVQLGDLSHAAADLIEATRLSPNNADAWYGLALARRAQGRLPEGAAAVAQALKLDPSRQEFRQLAVTLPEHFGARTHKPRPAGLVMPFIAQQGHLRFQNGRPIDVRGVNMGVALPGKFPAEFPRGAIWDTWMTQLGALHANVLRVYTILPPDFYQALLRYNLAHPRSPLYVIHGVWTELPANNDFRGRFQDDFRAEMGRVLGVLHGDVDLPARPGHASGRYDADVSRYLLAFIIGREWEPDSVDAFNRLARNDTAAAGPYVQAHGASPMEAWLARSMDWLVSEQMRRYHQLTPVAFTNWPTLDPLRHPSEASPQEEAALRAARGEPKGDPVRKAFGEDVVALDPVHVVATAKNPAGTFASYHAYPYYPDFMNHDAAYRTAPGGNYAGYLRALRAHHGPMPVLISEYGVPSSRSIAHYQMQGQHHGGHSEDEQARMDVDLDRTIRRSGLAGGIVFAWLDEWFKRNWMYFDLERPANSKPRWLNSMDAEEHYGLLATDPAGEPTLCSAASATLPLVNGTDGLHAEATPAALHLAWRTQGTHSEVRLDVHPAPGDEFHVVLDGTSGQVLVNSGYRPFKPRPVGRQTYYLYDPHAQPVPGAPFVPYITLPNIRRIGRDGAVYPAQTDEPGRLRGGGREDPRSHNLTQDFCTVGGWTHLRLPWTLLNVTDPSDHRVQDGRPAAGPRDQTVRISGIGVQLRSGTLNTRGTVTWNDWQLPAYTLREKPLYRALQLAWANSGS
ncbi:tetratricopeptide repeat protein [Deinococcus sonorensis]|uniref:Tetratricopeptide repeat protein n=1 Tax=Deinococcus sonorensis TaxID=309891 RepID=A0ABV8YBH6_9DEIO